MSATDGPARRSHELELHEIRVEGHLDERWADWEGLTFTHESDGTTTLTGPLADQAAALHGVLTRIRDLALPIVSVRRLGRDAERAIR